ncbi:MAG: ABC transporter permease [Bdellovibrionota bacterium]
MIFLRLAIKSLRNRMFATSLTAISIALSITLLLAVERTKRAAEEGFTQSVSQVDLLVGARTGPLNLILYTVFNMGSASNNISWNAYQEIKSKPEVAWTIPYSLGDGHKGFRVIGTDENFYEHYRFRGEEKPELAEGAPALGIWDAAIGSTVAKQLGYKLGDKIVIDHGVTKGVGIQHHDDKPFQVSGILKPTGTALDDSIYISLFGTEAMHIDWQSGAAPDHNHHVPATSIKKENMQIDQITAFFLRTKSRVETLRLQREINSYAKEPLLAVIPGVTLGELWRGLSQIEQILKIISWMVIFVGLAAMLSTLLAGLNERRREMAILRSLGAGPARITLLMVFESAFLTLIGIILGVVFNLCGFFILQNWLQNEFGLYMVGPAFTSTEFIYLLITFVFGIFVGLIPAYKASKAALKDGLAVRV